MTAFHYIGLSSLLLLTIPVAHAAGNTTQDSFNKAKRTLERSVYADHRETLYCGAASGYETDIARSYPRYYFLL
ncbi:hypothetical protein VXS05_17635 [Photobacterium toruni]|uniref:hypothetical protein n=1 Tax=Photobacterium toruni TaxID=1935446 RepID=UPI002E19C56F|nr:hypothetical protein [Photobacterium toruni]